MIVRAGAALTLLAMTAATSGFTEDAAKPAFQAIEDARTARRCAARPRGELITITTGIAEGTVDE